MMMPSSGWKTLEDKLACEREKEIQPFTCSFAISVVLLMSVESGDK